VLPLQRRGAAAVVLIADSVGEQGFAGIASVSARGTYTVVNGAPRFVRPGAPPPNPSRPVPILLAHRALAGELSAPGAMLDIRIRQEVFETPSVNIIGMVRGTDPALRDEYVVFSSHQDHDGVRFPVDGDSIWAGADDNGSTSVALLAIARAWVHQPAKRSALFIFHGAEERGLLGSRYHAMHPVVPLERMVAVLNGDMIGRNSIDSAALMGSQPPHRNSLELVNLAIQANAAAAGFVIDSTWDRPDHPEGWYFRSDHVPYAERRVPALFFSSNLHPDYHTPRDTPERINYPKLYKMSRWMYLTGWLAANAAQRPAVDPDFVLR
jgi:Zn-dependent M28 family amino/carboxypeptidase